MSLSPEVYGYRQNTCAQVSEALDLARHAASRLQALSLRLVELNKPVEESFPGYLGADHPEASASLAGILFSTRRMNRATGRQYLTYRAASPW